MSAPKHTPGPWRLVETDEGHEIHFGSRITSPGHFRSQHRPVEYEHGCFDSPDQFAEALANGRVMTASPKLLESLEDVIRAWLHEANQGDGIMEEHAPILAKARAVIAEAKGGAQ